MESLILLEISLVLLAIVLGRLFINKRIQPVIKLVIGMSSALWIYIPMLLTIFWNDIPEHFYVSKGVYMTEAVIEVWFYILIIVLTQLLTKKKFAVISPWKKINIQGLNFNILWWVLFVCAWSGYASSFASAATYNDVNEISTLSNPAFSVGRSLSACSTILFLICVTELKLRISRLKYVLSCISIIIGSILLVKVGSRMSLIMPIFIFIYYICANFTAKTVYYLTLLALLLIPTMNIMINVQKHRMKGELKLDTVTQDVFRFDDAMIKLSFLELRTKLNSVNYGSLLNENTKPVGISPIINTLFIPFPRAIFPGKPFPESVDGKITGQPARICANKIYRGNTRFNVGVASSQKLMWQMGWIGYFIGIIAIALALSVINVKLNGYNLFTQLFLFSLLINAGTFIIPSIDGAINLFITNAMNFLLLYIIIYIVRIFITGKLSRVSFVTKLK